MTPMQEQYNKIKSEFADHLILFRLGDFYECFNDDAVKISRILGITLTARGKDENRTPMAGIPHHALKNYLPKLINSGHKIAIADQMEEATPGKIVSRKITKIITPGTIMDEDSMENSKNNFIACISFKNNLYSFAYSDISTGELNLLRNLQLKEFKNEIFKVSPKEILVFDEKIIPNISFVNALIEVIHKSEVVFQNNFEFLTKHFKVKSLKSFGLDDSEIDSINLIGILLKYIEKTQQTVLKHFTKINLANIHDSMILDSETIKNLELIINSQGSNENTLYTNLNHCKTSMGKRLLYKWILNPLVQSAQIQQRLDLVEQFYKFPRINDSIISLLEGISDIERICGRIGINTAHPKDIIGLNSSLKKSLAIFNELSMNSELNSEIFKDFLNGSENLEFTSIEKVIYLIDETILEDAPALSNIGDIFKSGYNQRLDELREFKHDSKNILLNLQKREIEETGIASLKISFNNVFGYYIEVTNSNSNKVPDRYIRKQTLANCERFITPELKAIEEKILTSESEIIKLEFQLFNELRNKIAEYLNHILELSKKIAEIDVLTSFGFIARIKEYCKPEIENEKILNIRDGRHPIVENLVEKFSENNSHFDKDNIIHILTGPNMSGKSTYIRQVAIIALMAQIGSYIPAKSMTFKPFDRIFTRVGASDNLSRGESTFMVEMTETANILNNATNNSLIILDEVGRGTSTYDGVAIAWSIIQYISKNIQAFTLFATHYHELIALADSNNHIKNFNVEVEDSTEDIVFRHKIIPGGSDKSYGLHVAKLAGIPGDIIQEASNILKSFETSSKAIPSEKQSGQKKLSKPKRIDPSQLVFLSEGGTK